MTTRLMQSALKNLTRATGLTHQKVAVRYSHQEGARALSANHPYGVLDNEPQGLATQPGRAVDIPVSDRRYASKRTPRELLCSSCCSRLGGSLAEIL